MMSYPYLSEALSSWQHLLPASWNSRLTEHSQDVLKMSEQGGSQEDAKSFGLWLSRALS